MHERTSIHDELSAAMLDAPEICAQCGRTLTDDEPYLCDTCTEAAYCAGSDICEPWSERFPSPWIPRALDWPAVVMLASFLAVAVGTWGWQQVQAQDATVTRSINDRPYTWTLPEAGCSFLRGWEDQSGLAWCPDGLVRYDPEDEHWYAVSVTR